MCVNVQSIRFPVSDSEETAALVLILPAWLLIIDCLVLLVGPYVVNSLIYYLPFRIPFCNLASLEGRLSCPVLWRANLMGNSTKDGDDGGTVPKILQLKLPLPWFSFFVCLFVFFKNIHILFLLKDTPGKLSVLKCCL